MAVAVIHMDKRQKKILWGLFGVMTVTVIVALVLLTKERDDETED